MNLTTTFAFISNLVISIFGITAAIITLFFFIKGGYNTLKLYNKGARGICDILTELTKMTRRANNFMEKLLPRLLDELTTKDVLGKSILATWTEIVSAENFTTQSPKYLNDLGRKLLEDSGIKKIIDNNLDDFIGNLEATNIKSPQDVENNSFEIIKAIENTDKDIPIRNFLYNNPNMTIYNIFFIGSLYLRDKYLLKHPELLDEASSNSI